MFELSLCNQTGLPTVCNISWNVVIVAAFVIIFLKLTRSRRRDRVI